MKIWIESPFDNLPQEGFRRQRYCLMAEAFADAGHEVTYWTMDFNHGTKAKRVMTVAAEPRIRFRIIPARPYERNVCFGRILSHAGYAKDLKRAMLSETEGPDVVIAATPTLGSAEAALDCARHFGAKFVIDIQDAWPETFYRLLPSGVKWLGCLLFASMHSAARRLYQEADFVTGVSAKYGELCGRDDFHLAYHGISGAVSPVRSDRRQAAGRLVYVGNLGEGYDLETVFEAMEQKPEITLEIAGKGPKETMLRELAEAKGLQRRVTFHGYLGERRLGELMAECEIGIIPMRDDSWVGLPYKLGDYLVSGLKVVSSLHGECGRLIEGNRIGAVYEFGSSASFLAALRKAATLPIDGVRMPDELAAERIYPAYVDHIITSTKQGKRK